MRTIKPITQDILDAIVGEMWCWAHNGSSELIPKRIAERIEVDTESGCWRVKGWNSKNGFANISILGNTIKVHRLMYTLFVGPIPDGMVVDHSRRKGCRHRDCCNPEHLEAVTVKENTDRGDSVPFMPKQKAPPLIQRQGLSRVETG